MENMEELMGNHLQMASQQYIRALLELNWSYRRIGGELGIRRETMARYDDFLGVGLAVLVVLGLKGGKT